MTRRIMRAFKMQEISAVDRPAQVHARMAIMKRATPADLDGGIHLTSHVGDIDMDAAALKKMIDDAIKAAVDPLNKANTDLKKANEELTAKLAKAFPPKKKVPVTADDEPDADDAAKAAWRPYVEARVAAAVAKKDEDHAAALAKAAEVAKGDEVVEYDGKEVRKSVVGEGTFSVLKGLLEKDQLNDFSKRADAEIKSLPGETIAKARALRAISKLSKEDRETVEAMLKAGQTAMTTALKSVGHSQVSEGSAEQEIEKGVLTLMAAEKLSRMDAYTKFMSTSDGKALYKRSIEKAA